MGNTRATVPVMLRRLTVMGWFHYCAYRELLHILLFFPFLFSEEDLI